MRLRTDAVASDARFAELNALHDARLEEMAAVSEARLEEVRAAKDVMAAQFSEVSNRLLAEAQKSFLERADARFRQSEESTGQSLRAMLQPVNERLSRYEETVAKVEQERKGAFDMLSGQLEQMRIGQEKVSSEAAKLVNSLRNAPKSRGRWGEQQLRNVLETCGLSEHTDFQTEVSVAMEDGGRLRPDAIVKVPGGRALVIDAKVSLNAYQDAFGAVDEAERFAGLKAHCDSMRAHINGLGAKAYWSQFAEAPDYVIMFVPGEHFLSAALEHDPTLWDTAFDKRVLLATPTNLIAIARTVAAVWRQEKLAKEAAEIGRLGKELYERLAVAGNHLRVVGSGLGTAVDNYNKFVGSFERNVLSTGRKFRDLNIEDSAKQIPEVAQVEALARYADERLQLDVSSMDEAAE
ncbi:DNA recombination protein RmuC [Sphingomonas aracearum]